jgi:hypothetical protein
LKSDASLLEESRVRLGKNSFGWKLRQLNLHRIQSLILKMGS